MRRNFWHGSNPGMGYERDGNDPYLYPGTEVLRNLEGLKEEQSLSGFETEAVLFRHVSCWPAPFRGILIWPI